MNKTIFVALLVCTFFGCLQAVTLKEALEQVHETLPNNLKLHSLALQKAIETKEFACMSCEGVFTYLQNMDISDFFSSASVFLEYFCDKYHLLGDGTCEGALNEMGPYLLINLQQRYLDPKFVCPELNVCAPVYETVDIQSVLEDILVDTPVNNTRSIPTQQKTLKVMHITDLHFDWQYQHGSVSNCAEPTCCRANSTTKSGKIGVPADYWGSLASCDLPYRTIEAFVQYLKTSGIADSLDFALWTGDNTNHFIWEQNQTANINSTLQITQLLQKELPNLKIYPIMGNHESFPCNVYDYEGDREKELKTEFANAWEYWIGPEAAEEFKQNGFYSTVINPNGEQQVRLLAVNTQAANPMNFYLIKNPTDPDGQLNWMQSQLTIAEKLNQKVYIMGHIPSDSLTEEWSEVYNALIERYQNIIIGQFYGHTHDDEIRIYKNNGTNTVNNVAFIAPSITTFSSHNPSFRVFQMDAATMLPVNYFQYRMNITKFNNIPDKDASQIYFDVAYDFNSQYGFTDMSELKNFETLASQIQTNLPTFQNYMFNKYSGANSKKYTKITASTYCQLNSTPELVGLCSGKYTPGIMDKLIGSWFKRIPKADPKQQ